MIKRTILLMGTAVLAFLLLTACGDQSDSVSGNQAYAQDIAAGTIESTPVMVTESMENTAATNVGNQDAGVVTVADAAAENDPVLEDEKEQVSPSTIEPTIDSSEVTEIVLAGDSITAEGDGVTVAEQVVTITSAGVYSLSGQLTNGQIVVDTEDEEVVQLILKGIQISNESTSPIYIANAAETILLLAENSENYVTDGTVYVYEDVEEDEPNAAIFSKDKLVISGDGTLTVEANYNDGITSKDELIISGGTLTVHAHDDGIRGKDFILVQDGFIMVNAQGDGLKSDEDTDETKGYIMIENGVFDITSGADAIQAQTDVLISGGEFILTAGGGSDSTIGADDSAKGIKGGVSVIIDGGSFNINTADDAVHSNESMIINDGMFVVVTGDDGFHADDSLTFNGGVVQITGSYEGIESAVITINNGEFWIASSDDGINVAGGNDGSGFNRDPGGGGRPGGGGPGQDAFNVNSDYKFTINGGYIVVDARGDGIDINGTTEMTDGVLIINGPTEQMNGAVDVDGAFTINGGFMVAAGSAGMAQTATTTSTQNALLMNFNGTIPADTLIHIEDSNGNSILTFAPTVAYQSIAFSSQQLKIGETYTVYYDGTASGTPTDGLYENATYSPGTELGSITITDTITRIGNSGRR